MLKVSHYVPAERQREKNRAREADDFALRNGQISRVDLQRQNGFFASLEIISSSLEFQDELSDS